MTKHVISTLAADQKYTTWETTHGVGTVLRSVLVKGGASVASPGSGAIITPEGVSTTVSDEDARFLSEHPEFQKHQERGFVKIVGPALDANAVAQKMSKDEGSRPRTAADVKKFSESKGKSADASLQAVTNAR